jgi:TolA-binding protein
MILDFSLRKIEAENIALSNERQEMQLQLKVRVEETQSMQAQLAGLAGKVAELREMQMRVAETQKQLESLRSTY